VWHALIEGDRGWREVAIKLLRLDIEPGGHAARRLEDEARLLEQLRHAAFPWFLGVADLDGRTALISELVDGADLDACMRGPDPLPLRAGLEALADVSSALEAAWSREVQRPDGAGPLRLVHRDIKPSNLRLSRDGQLKVLDFGIAWTDQITREASTGTGAMIGSPPYMAPERYQGASPDPAADVYSVGCVLFELLCRRRLWRELTSATLAGVMVDASRHQRALAVRLTELPADVDPALRELLLRTLAWEPAERPSHAECGASLLALSERTPGPGLRAWARGHAWPDHKPDPSQRRTLVEGRQTAREPRHRDTQVDDPQASPPTWDAPAAGAREGGASFTEPDPLPGVQIAHRIQIAPEETRDPSDLPRRSTAVDHTALDATASLGADAFQPLQTSHGAPPAPRTEAAPIAPPLAGPSPSAPAASPPDTLQAPTESPKAARAPVTQADEQAPSRPFSFPARAALVAAVVLGLVGLGAGLGSRWTAPAGATANPAAPPAHAAAAPEGPRSAATHAPEAEPPAPANPTLAGPTPAATAPSPASSPGPAPREVATPPRATSVKPAEPAPPQRGTTTGDPAAVHQPPPAAPEPPPPAKASVEVLIEKPSYAPFLKGEDGRRQELPARGRALIPPGKWTVYVAFIDQNWQPIRTIELQPGAAYTLTCALKTCSLR
jgi:serine/threonine protein kinase